MIYEPQQEKMCRKLCSSEIIGSREREHVNNPIDPNLLIAILKICGFISCLIGSF